MGGARGGREASRLALETAARAFAAAPPGQPLDQALATAFQAANAAVHQKAQRDPALAGMGTTLVALACREGRGVAANVGDSRLYLLRWGELRQISRDHGLVAEQVRQGRLSPAEARHHALRNVLTRALGVAPELEVDLFPLTCGPGISSCSAPTAFTARWRTPCWPGSWPAPACRPPRPPVWWSWPTRPAGRITYRRYW